MLCLLVALQWQCHGRTLPKLQLPHQLHQRRLLQQQLPLLSHLLGATPRCYVTDHLDSGVSFGQQCNVMLSLHLSCLVPLPTMTNLLPLVAGACCFLIKA